MHRPLYRMFFVYLTITTISPAFAADAVTIEANSGSNIFSTPDAQESDVPRFTEARRDKAANARKLLLGNKRDDIPNLRQVLNLPSLTPMQRRTLGQMIKANKVQAAELTNKLKTMKERRDTAGGGAVPARQDAQEFIAIRKQIQNMRRQVWEDIKSKLSEQQLKDLEAMRKGELEPATFRTANDGAMMGR